MKEILETATELGLLIKDTDVWKNFDEISQILEENSESKNLMNEFNAITEEHHRRRTAGDIIESYEEKNRLEIMEKVKSDPILTKYITAREDYINMLTEIQEAMKNDDF